MKKAWLFICGLLFPLIGISQPLPDVVQYEININSIDFAAQTISGHTNVVFCNSTTPLSTLELSLLKLNIDSIITNSGVPLSYQYNDTNLTITLSAPLSVTDTDTVAIYYHGSPKLDPSNWGGFYFSGTFAFNMGVGFDADPHCFGRAWFPSNDVFTDRASFRFHIRTPAGYKAFCNGQLTGIDTITPAILQWNWDFSQEIPTYLASVAVAPYATWERNYQGIPVEIAALPADTANVTGTFTHLDSTLYHYIHAYGPYPYDKVGYCLIPFNSGAMEHASSIHIGKAFVAGTLTYETLWMHELSHMWWGDQVTCATAGDMWLNEGFASFNEGYMTQQIYGDAAYRQWIKSNLRPVLQFAHITDGGYLPLINIPHAHTYGPTVYNKGAAIAHTLRYYMGDSLFFAGCKAYLNNKSNQNVTSYDLRDQLAAASGMNLTRFFDDWVFTPGFPHFSIDSVVFIPGGLNHYFVYTRQKSKGNNHLYEMPVQITLSDYYSDTTFTVTIDSATNVFHFATPNNIEWFTIDKNDRMADAITADERRITSTGSVVFNETAVTVNTQQTGGDTSIVRAEHHWVTPDPFKVSGQGIRISDYHYWKIDGLFKSGYHAKATFPYNGSTSTTTGYLDNTLITGTEDSIVLLYRAGAADDWQIVTSYTQNTGNKFDKMGNFVIDSLKIGEYAFGYRDYTTGQNIPGEKYPVLNIWPNPSRDGIQFCLGQEKQNQSYQVNIYDLQGKYLFSKTIYTGTTEQWTPRNGQKGTFIMKITSGNQEINVKKFQLL
ncbi:MAG: M1 family aminopeptidase [Bacteroidia bacterium]